MDALIVTRQGRNTYDFGNLPQGAEAGGIVVRLFNMDDADYKRFLNFLRKHHCQLPYREYR